MSNLTLLNKSEGIPLYIQIRRTLRDEISDQTLVPGQKLPSEDELAARFGVSRMTVRQGISDLIDEGLALPPARGGHVRRPAPPRSRSQPPDQFSGIRPPGRPGDRRSGSGC